MNFYSVASSRPFTQGQISLEMIPLVMFALLLTLLPVVISCQQYLEYLLLIPHLNGMSPLPIFPTSKLAREDSF